MTRDATSYGDIYPDRDNSETRSIAERLRTIFRAHRPDPDEPDHRCLCGYDGESYDDHLAQTTLREMKEVGYEVWPARHG